MTSQNSGFRHEGEGIESNVRSPVVGRSLALLSAGGENSGSIMKAKMINNEGMS